MNVVRLSIPERFLHGIGRTGVAQFDPVEVHALEMEAILEHRKWLLCMVGQHPCSFQITPFEGVAATAPHQEKSIALVDLRKKIGRASCRERVYIEVGSVCIKKK